MEGNNSEIINQMVKLSMIRKEKKKTLEDMAFELGISSVSLSRYERGKRDMPYRIYVKYAELLGFEVREILK